MEQQEIKSPMPQTLHSTPGVTTPGVGVGKPKLKSAWELLKSAWADLKQKYPMVLKLIMIPLILSVVLLLVASNTRLECLFVQGDYLLGQIGAVSEGITLEEDCDLQPSGYIPASVSVPIFLLVLLAVNIFSVIIFIASVRLFGKDEHLSFKEYLIAGKNRFWSYIWLSIVYGLVVMGGFLLFIVPGVIFSVWFGLAFYVLMLEDRKGLESMMRSKHLIAGYFGSTIWRGVFFGIVSLVIMAPVFIVSAFLPKDFLAGGLFSNLWSYLILWPLGLAYFTGLFKNFTEIKPQPFEYDKKSGRKFVWIGVGGIILGFVFLGFLVAMFLKFYNSSYTLQNQLDAQTDTSTQFDELTASWQTYHNEEFGLEFTYSSERYAIDELSNYVPESDAETLVILYDKIGKAETIECNCGSFSRFKVHVSDNQDKLSLIDFANKNYKSYLYNLVETSVSGYDAIRFGERDSYILVAKDDLIFIIEPINEILSTFRFIE